MRQGKCLSPLTACGFGFLVAGTVVPVDILCLINQKGLDKDTDGARIIYDSQRELCAKIWQKTRAYCEHTESDEPDHKPGVAFLIYLHE